MCACGEVKEKITETSDYIFNSPLRRPTCCVTEAAASCAGGYKRDKSITASEKNKTIVVTARYVLRDRKQQRECGEG